MSYSIQVENVSKDFSLLINQPSSFKSVLVNALRGNFHLGNIQKFTALKDVTFDVQEGEFLAIMGRNGAGKSTLMKLITGIYSPTKGTIRVNGRIAPLIELGAGFHGDLTGEENIFLNSSILGVGRKSALDAMPKILEFADIGDFIRVPVRNYSSGMLVRLGFSIAVHLDAPILILDEVLGVGDQGFFNKCQNRITDLHRQGKTILFVTHSPSAVEELCSRCIVIESHELVFDGDPKEGSKIYQDIVLRRNSLPELLGESPMAPL
jgi:ABC-type polysaccharide/polyol phosphate transport system ATPase subunit